MKLISKDRIVRLVLTIIAIVLLSLIVWDVFTFGFEAVTHIGPA